MHPDQLIQTISIAAIPVLFAITLHEAAHGYVARHFGDMTAYQQGRISLNPLRHIDPLGTVLFPLLTLWLGGILFGWAKPVPVNFAALRRPKQDMLWVSIAGPASSVRLSRGRSWVRVPSAPPYVSIRHIGHYIKRFSQLQIEFFTIQR